MWSKYEEVEEDLKVYKKPDTPIWPKKEQGTGKSNFRPKDEGEEGLKELEKGSSNNEDSDDDSSESGGEVTISKPAHWAINPGL